MEFIGAVVICVYGVEESHQLTDQLREVFLELIYRKEFDAKSTRILNQMQEYVSCTITISMIRYLYLIDFKGFYDQEKGGYTEYGFRRVHGKALSNERSFLVRTDWEGEGEWVYPQIQVIGYHRGVSN